MKIRVFVIVVALAFVGAATSAQRTSAPLRSLQAPDETLALVDVNVIPMDRERVLSGQTVLVFAGRIAAVGAVETVHVPPNATRVDGRGRLFVMPGLADMHVHLRYESDLPLVLANGVTTVRNMRGTPFHLDLRRRVADGTLLDPRIVTVGPVLHGEADSGRTPESARAAVEAQSAAG
jgi:hypothetical protein